MHGRSFRHQRAVRDLIGNEGYKIQGPSYPIPNFPSSRRLQRLDSQRLRRLDLDPRFKTVDTPMLTSDVNQAAKYMAKPNALPCIRGVRE